MKEEDGWEDGQGWMKEGKRGGRSQGLREQERECSQTLAFDDRMWEKNSWIESEFVNEHWLKSFEETGRSSLCWTEGCALFNLLMMMMMTKVTVPYRNTHNQPEELKDSGGFFFSTKLLLA